MNNYKQQMQKMINTASQLSAEEIKEQVIKLNDNFDDNIDHVLTALINALENKISTDEFVSFCDAL